jgi:molybdopterin molybdotransferase
VLLDTEDAAPGQHVLLRGSLLAAGVEAVRAGCPLGGAQIGLLAEIGRSTVRAVPRPCVAVLATGNELVPADQTPSAGQIRNSNGPMLMAAISECGAQPTDLGIAADEPDDLREKIARGLEADVLLLSGGVSAGVLDLVPQLLVEAGVREVFHKVCLKPGKPLWFGTHEHSDGRKVLVFGLPGNPVSSFVCYTLFVRPALARLAGRDDRGSYTRARLTEPYTSRRPRPTYHPAILDEHTTKSTVRLTDWRGSADLAAFTRANCLALLPSGDEGISKGEMVDIVRC